MGIRIHKPGLLDTIQDAGRFGYQHWGINPGGAMDRIAMQVANMLVGNDADEAVMEMHFPAAEIVFEKNALIALAGADMAAVIDGLPVDVSRPLPVSQGSTLVFRQAGRSSRVYLSVRGGFVTHRWLGSHSTNLTIHEGGMKRALQKNDRIGFRHLPEIDTGKAEKPLWRANTDELYVHNGFRFIPGEEYHLLNGTSREQLVSAPFLLSRTSNRMGYRLQGNGLQTTGTKQMISGGVVMGTMQLLPDGQLIVLMADHQTTGGYPRIGHVISADIPSLSRMLPGSEISFILTGLADAEERYRIQQRNLRRLKNACTLRLNDYLKQ